MKLLKEVSIYHLLTLLNSCNIWLLYTQYFHAFLGSTCISAHHQYYYSRKSYS